MVAEGIVALIWAAAAIAFTGGYGELGEYLAENGGTGGLVHNISIEWLGAFGGMLAILGVVAAPHLDGRHRTSLRSTHSRRLHALQPEEHCKASSRVGAHFCRYILYNAGEFRCAVALLRLVQPDTCRVHSMGHNGVSCPQRQAVLGDTVPAMFMTCVYDLYTFCTRRSWA